MKAVFLGRQANSWTVTARVVRIASLAVASMWLLASPVQAAPEIAVVTEPACNGEVIVLTGEGFDPASTRVVAAVLGEEDGDFNPQKPHDPADYIHALNAQPPLPETPPDNALPCEVLGGDERSEQYTPERGPIR